MARWRVGGPATSDLTRAELVEGIARLTVALTGPETDLLNALRGIRASVDDGVFWLGVGLTGAGCVIVFAPALAGNRRDLYLGGAGIAAKALVDRQLDTASSRSQGGLKVRRDALVRELRRRDQERFEP